ncbi:MAG: succinate dehydrogenase, hydrophobic membrane anchor protein [Gammaproteobacteria bacterium]|nr:succinate dehydrogenase, hydrophobic membrane anchor protein [Gammaproteobacteria bacterium]
MSLVALEGLRPWVLQRLTAVYLVVYAVYVVAYWLIFADLGFDSWRSWVATELNQILLGLFYLAVLIHAWVGVRDILLDYVKPLLLKLMLLFAVAVFLIGSGFWLLKILMMVNT